MPDRAVTDRDAPASPLPPSLALFQPIFGSIVGADFADEEHTIIHVAVDPTTRVGKWNVVVSHDPGWIDNLDVGMCQRCFREMTTSVDAEARP